MNRLRFEVALAPAPEGRAMVLLQCEDRWWSLLTADGAHELARMLTEAADELDAWRVGDSDEGGTYETTYNDRSDRQ